MNITFVIALVVLLRFLANPSFIQATPEPWIGNIPNSIVEESIGEVQSISYTIRPSFSDGAPRYLEMLITANKCSVQVIQKTDEDDTASYVIYEQKSRTPPDAYKYFSEQAIDEIVKYRASGWLETDILDGDIVKITLNGSEGTLSVGGINADEFGPQWFVGLCTQMKRILKDAGLDLNAAQAILFSY